MDTKEIKILGIDVGFTNTGWAIYDVLDDKFLKWGVIVNEQIPVEDFRQRNQLQIDSDRIRKLARELYKIVSDNNPAGFVIETGSGFQAARATYTMGLANGIVFSLISWISLMDSQPRYIDVVRPQSIKHHFAKKFGNKGTKQDISVAVKARWPAIRPYLLKFTKARSYHITDAMAAVGVSCDEESGLVRMLRSGHTALENARKKAIEEEEEKEKALVKFAKRLKSQQGEIEIGDETDGNNH